MDQQIEATNEKSGTSTPSYPIDQAEAPVTLRSWLYALLGCFLYFVISFDLAATSQWRTAQGAFFGRSSDSIWLLNCVSIAQAALGPVIMSISDIVGRRWVLIVVAAISVVGSALSASATSFDMALAGQTLASVGLATVGAGYAIPSEVMRK